MDYSKSDHLFVEMKRRDNTCQCIKCACVWVGVGAIVSAAHEYNKYMRIAAIRGKMGKKGVKWTSRDWRKGRKASKGRVIK